MKEWLGKLGGQLGVGLCVVGFLLVFLGWNGAASRNFLPAQFPYLISGGIAGLCFVVLGVGTIIVQNQRADRAELQRTLEQLIEAMERIAAPRPNGQVEQRTSDGLVAGRDSYHRADCRLVQGRSESVVVTLEEAVERGLNRCRVCNPPPAQAPEDAPPEITTETSPPRRGGRLRAR